WYDVWSATPDHLLVVVGDVSGRGLHAAAVMASLRFATRAYAALGEGPTGILTKLCGLLDIEHDGHLATMVCAEVDLAHRTMTLANAGHPKPIFIDADGGRFIDMPIGPPIGVVAAAEYRSVTIDVPADATFLAFTDGLFERRGELLDIGLERVLAAATEQALPLNDLVGRLYAQLTGDAAADDVAILAVRWHGA
ncbi:MAG TPA: PP2C family protein-serine/threonine phosphatase, partial [Acidimicrobiales bacterium]